MSINMKTSIWIAAALVTLLAACGVTRQVMEAKALADCQFRMGAVSDVQIGTLSLDRVTSLQSLSLLDMGTLMTSFSSGSLPLRFTANVQVRNPNAVQAALNRLEWIAEYEGKEMARGAVNQRIEIPAMATSANLPVQVQTDLRQLLQGEGLTKLLEIGMRLRDKEAKEIPVNIRVKPTLLFGSREVVYPGYINVKYDLSEWK